MATEDDRHAGYHSSPPSQWAPTPHVQPHSYHGTPATEYSGFQFSTPQLPMEPGAFSSAMQPRTMAQPLQPLVMPQWPSMLSSQSHATFQPMFPQPVQPIQPMSIGQLQTPVSATSTRPTTTTPRKTLTDSDRKRMCQYAEEHPNSKQTEIGAIFGVERSTVSKVLRQKEKYLMQDEGSKSPVKRAKGRSPDLERTLAIWAKNQVRGSDYEVVRRLLTRDEQEKKGLRLTDEIIYDQARAFAITSKTPNEERDMISSSWIEKFKLKHNLMGARSRKSSLAPADAEGISVPSSSHTPSGTSPISPHGVGSPELHSAQSQESLKVESPDSLGGGFGRGPWHSQSTTSLNSAFTDTAPSSFSPSLSNTTSPIFTPDSGTAPGPFMAPPQTARLIPPVQYSSNSHRPRSQTFPQLESGLATSVMDEPTPKYPEVLGDTPMEEAPDTFGSINDALRTHPLDERPHTVTPAETMRPPPLPAHVFNEHRRNSASAASSSPVNASTSPDEARRALEVVMSFIEQQPRDFLDFQETLHMGKLMEKLKLQSRSSS